MRLITDVERRSRLAVRHGLAAQFADPLETATNMVGLHSSDPATVFLSIRARVPDVTVADIESALYEERALARILGMRRTMWVVPESFASTVNASSTVALERRERKKTVEMAASMGMAHPEVWVDEVANDTLQAIRSRGQALARDLTKDVPELSRKVTFRRKDGSILGTVGMSTRILFLLSAQGRVTRARPAGTWLSSQYRWTEPETWFGAPFSDVDEETARAEVVRRWLLCFGPGSETDIKWWTGWTLGVVRKALEAAGAVGVRLDGGDGFVLDGDESAVGAPAPWVSLLPSLDPTAMGWKERAWYLGELYPRLFDRSGNAGPTVWADGRVVGGWAQRKTGEVVYEVFEDVGRETLERIEVEVANLQAWLGEVVVTPRFRSPHDKELTA